MPQKLSEPIEDQVRKYVVDNADPSAMEGYDPTQTDTTASDYILVTSDNDDWGDYYPLIYVSETESPTVVGGGQTNATGLQSDGSGTNQYSIYTVTLSVQAVENGPYLNSVAYDELVFTIYQELRSIFNAGRDEISDSLWVGSLTPPTQTRSSDETDSGSTDTWCQRQGTLPVGIQYTP